MTAPVLTTPVELYSRLAHGDPAPVVLDVRWRLGDPHGHEHYLAGHLPSAVYVDLDTELAAPATPERVRHPLPVPAALQRAARRWGLTAGRPVVVYDDNGNTAAARAWWLLRWAGVERVSLLDGALAAWRAAGLPVETGEPAPPPEGDVVLAAGHLPVLDADAAARWLVRVSCWTRGRPSGTGARRSRSIRAPGTFPAPAPPRRATTWRRTARSARCGAAIQDVGSSGPQPRVDEQVDDLDERGDDHVREGGEQHDGEDDRHVRWSRRSG